MGRDFGFNGRKPIKLTDAATVLIDAASGHVFVHEGSLGRILDGPTGGYDGQKILIRSKNTGGSPITHTLDVTGANSFRYPPGFNALQPIPADSVGAYIAQYHAGDTKWDVLGDSLGASTTAAGNSGEVQYNNAGTVAGAANVEVEGGNLKLVSTTDPAVPAGGILLYSKSVAGRHLPKIIGPSGIDTTLQISLHGNAAMMIAPANGTTAPTAWGGVLTTAATISHQQTIASANPWQATRRTRFQTSTTAGNASGMRTAYAQWFRGNAAGFGGFFFRTQFGMNINLNGGQKFIGLCASTAVLASTAGAVAALLNMCGVGFDTTDASTGNWFFYRNDGTGTATKVGLGATNAARNTTHGYDLIMYMAPNGSDLFVRIINLHSGVTVLDTSYNTDLPVVNTGMAFKAEVNNGAVAAADNLEVAKVYIETDY